MGKGFILVETCVKGCARNIQMHDLFHVPDLHSNLLSVRKFISRGLKVHFNSLGCIMRASNKEVLVVASNSYHLNTNVMNEAETSSLAYLEANLHLVEQWNKRLGHVNAINVKSLQTMMSGIDVQVVPNNVHLFVCGGCFQGKQTRRQFHTE